MPTTNSRLTLARAAIRPAMRGRVMLAGPSGSGKTWTSLVIASVLHDELTDPGKRTLVIDTEKESALTFSDEFDFDHLRWKAPFDPRNLADTLLDPGLDKLYDVVNIDSFTHFWRGTGGTLDIANGKYTGWADARPAQVDVIEAILECPAHVIVCVREKQAHAQIEDRPGHWKVEKLGMEPIQDDTFEYEVNVSLNLDMQHTLAVSKSRTNAVPVGSQFHAGHAADFAVTYRDWLAAGEPVAKKAQTDAIVDVLNGIVDQSERAKAKSMFLDFFGRPEFILASKLDEAVEWAAEQQAAANGGAVTGSATAGADARPAEPTAHEHGEPAPDPSPEPEGTAPAPQQPVAAAQPEPAADAPANGEAAPEPAGEPAATLAESSVPPERLAKVQDTVKAYSLSKVRSQLEAAQQPVIGTPQQLRARLVEHLCNVMASADAAATA